MHTQDWIVKCLLGERARPLAPCGVWRRSAAPGAETCVSFQVRTSFAFSVALDCRMRQLRLCYNSYGFQFNYFIAPSAAWLACFKI
jgi:hypothetical protein